ncbi:membrane-bound serine protease (ClpP class) [Chryseolinea serpens]|uniref:Membrane-bound serine protease (ClpP class) n=1 Tax=Chryseolinea serpens TaxID=947013 RepID=A0A1M5TS30_9BACT|nr:nodulation protein NfeD [Chryseolinea serpens]SHH53582.1 membrane-bound serine protease (ClpP class) [Chryseolinea serpens]
MKTRLSVLIVLIPSLLLAQKKVVSIQIDGTINPASAEFIHRSIEKAGKENAECLVIQLNTPGGLLKSTRVIVSDILESPVPIVVFVSPGGAHAGSAGVFITLSAHIAAMAPGTNIGAAHPVDLQGKLDTVMSEKVTNDAAAFIRSIAEKRKRNVKWAEESVRKSISITEKEALKKDVIDLIAENTEALLDQIDGKPVTVASKTKTLETRDAKIELVEMGMFEKILDLISDPNVAYIFLLLGLYGMLFELYNPGAILPGIVGIICLTLAFYSMHTLPVNYAGLLLIVFGVILFLLEIKIVSHGMLTLGAIVSLLLGSMMLIRPDAELAFQHLSWGVIISAVGFSALFFLVVLGMGIRAQRLKPVTGVEGMIGEIGESLEVLNPVGTVRVHGEMWQAESLTGPIKKGARIRIAGIKDLLLFVETAIE